MTLLRLCTITVCLALMTLPSFAQNSVRVWREVPATPPRLAKPENCQNLTPPAEIILEGRLQRAILPGPPGFADVVQGDRPQPVYLLNLASPICFHSPDDEFLQNVTTNRVHLMPADTSVEAWLQRMVGRDVFITGGSAFGAYTGHHRAPVVLEARDVSGTSAQSLSEHDPVVNVRQFYEALGEGDGATASRLIAPWKRSGPFSAAAMTRYYGNLAERMKVLDIAPKEFDRYEVLYTFVDGNRRCNGRSLVTMARVNGSIYVETIRVLNGC